MSYLHDQSGPFGELANLWPNVVELMQKKSNTEIARIGDLSITPITIFLFVVLVLLLVLFCVLIHTCRLRYIRNKFFCKYNLSLGLCNDFSQKYQLELDQKIRIKRRQSSGSNCFRLEFPHWTRSNKDGSQDKRYKDNRINWGMCQLDIDEYSVFLQRPEQLIWLVNTLRRDGVSICMCSQEHDKYMRVVERAKLLGIKGSVNAIIDTFQESLTDFEEYCAALFRTKGYQAQTTSRSRDGGYDIEMISPIGESVIAECKCYTSSHKIDRPTVQKLVGANVIAMAQRMVFVTTSDFTPDACKYAKSAGVELINGKRLLGMAGGEAGSRLSIEVPISQWQLTLEDLEQYYPPDFGPLRIEL